MEILIFLTLLSLTFGPAVVVGVLPWPIWRPVAGWILLAIGLLWLEERNIPFEDQGMFGGMGLAWTKLVISTIMIAVIVKFFRSIDTGRPPPPHWAADWYVPAAILAGVFFFHWLANRMAGWSPASQVHLIGLGVCAAAVLLLERSLRRRPDRFGIIAFALSWAATVLALMLYAGLIAMRQFDQAVKEADGRPFCLLTYAGSHRASQVTDRWQLSPLVSRSGGRSYLDDRASWLFIDGSALTRKEREEDRERSRWKRDGNTLYRDTIIRPERPQRSIEQGSMPCRPSQDGGVSGP